MGAGAAIVRRVSGVSRWGARNDDSEPAKGRIIPRRVRLPDLAACVGAGGQRLARSRWMTETSLGLGDPAGAPPQPRSQARSRSGWGVVIAYAGVVAATQILWLTFAAIDTDVARDFSVSREAVGWLANVFPLAYVVLALPTGLALDRWFRSSLLTGAGLTALGGILRLVAPNYEWALTGQIVVAIAQPFVLNGLTKTATAYLPPERRGSGIALGSAAQFLGAIVALVMGPALQAGHGVELLLVVQAAIGCGAFAMLAASLRSPATKTADVGPRAGIGLGELRAAWSVRQLRTLSGLAFVGVGVFVAISTYLQPILHLDRISATDAGLMLAGMLAAGIAGCGILAPAVERRRAERAYLTVAVLLVTVFMTVLAFVHPAIGADFALIGATGFVLLTALPVMLSLIERRMSEFGGVATGVLLLAGNAGGLVVAVVVGLLSGVAVAAFLVLALAAALGLPFAWRVRSDEPGGAAASRQSRSRI
jgi:predicted MFS family arabinose efflux permease